MQSDVKIINDVAVVKVPNKFLDAFSAKAFRQEIMKLCEQGKKNFIIDMSDVDFVDSVGLGVLLLIYKAVGTEGGIVLIGVGKRVEETLKMASLQRILPAFDTLETALAHFPG